MKKSELLSAYAVDHNKEQIVRFASSLFGFDTDVEDGGKGSGNFGHRGRPGQRGGSGPGGGGGGSGESGGGYSYTPGQAVKSLGTVTKAKAKSHADNESKRQAHISLEKAMRPKETRIGSVKKVATALPVGTIVKHNGDEFVKQHNGDWIGSKSTIKRNDAPAMLENGGVITSVPKVTSYNKAIHNAKLRDANGYPKGNMTDEVKAYSEGKGVKTESLQKGSGVTHINGADLVNKQGKNVPNTLADNCMEVDGKLVLTPEREALHQQIVENTFAGKEKRKEGQPPHITILGGGPASGKGSFTAEGNKFGIPDSKHQVTIDPDEVKAQLPEYALEKDKSKSAAYAHEESSVVGKRMAQAAIENGYDYTLDGTGDNSAKSMMDKITAARNIGEGAMVTGAYMTCPTDVAVQSAKDRGDRTERYVPESIVRGTHSKVSHVFPQIASQFDHVELWDRSEGEAKLIATCDKGQPIKVLDKKAYKAFLDKDQEKYDPKKDLFDPRQYPYGKP